MTTIAIHQSKVGFHPRWISHCKKHNIPFKLVDCHASDIVEQLQGCQALLWHHSQIDPRDLLVAKAVLSALEHSGFRVFPDWRTGWHFDDKLAQKYLFEAIGAPFVPAWIFLDRQSAKDWIASTSFPKVFKLRGGAGSTNVRLARTPTEARKLVRRAFGTGFPNHDGWASLRERWRKFRLGRTSLVGLLKGVIRCFFPPPYARLLGRESGYVYFQEFVPGNDSDTRVVVIDRKAFALKRFVRKGDFRASGSGDFSYERDVFDLRCVRIAFEVTKRLGSQCAAYDFVFDQEHRPLLIEVSYGFVPEGYDACPGYWDEDLNWHEGIFDPQGWMVDALLADITRAGSQLNPG